MLGSEGRREEGRERGRGGRKGERGRGGEGGGGRKGERGSGGKEGGREEGRGWYIGYLSRAGRKWLNIGTKNQKL